MKIHRFLSPALGAILIATAPVLRAGDETRPEGAPSGERRERLQQGADRMAEELGLSDEQKAKMKEIGEQERAALEALKADTSLAKEVRRAKAQEIREKYRAQRHAVLTPEQQAKAEKMREKRGKMRDRLEKRQDRHGKAREGF
ncbi:MAG: Spy/CpxP family protein refolding chaperone [Verrucomicrobiota bacterium]